MKEENKKSWITGVIINCLLMASFIAASLLLTRFVIMNAYVPSESMENTLKVGDLLIGNRLTHDYKRGDILVFQNDEGKYFVKRLIGQPGDTVKIENNKVYINGEEIQEPYLREKMESEDFVFNVPEGRYLFLGDNRNVSLDARYWKDPYIPRDNIRAKIVFRYWPFNKIRTFK